MAWSIQGHEGVEIATGERFIDVLPALLRLMGQDHGCRVYRDGEPAGAIASKLLDRAYNEEAWVREAYRHFIREDRRYPDYFCGICKRDATADRCPGICEACTAEA